MKAKLLVLLLPLGLVACSAQQPLIPPPLQLPKKVLEQSVLAQETASSSELNTGIAETPKPPPPEHLQGVKAPAKPAPVKQEAANITLSFEQIPLPAFIQVVYATILKRNVTIDPQVMQRQDLVTLRTGKPMTAGQVETTVRLLLKSYGVAVVELGNMVHVVPDNASLGYLPEIRRGWALPETPLPLRPVFQLVELHAVRNPEITQWLQSMFGNKVRVQDDSGRNAVLLSGSGDDVQAAMEAIHVLDQPLMKGRHSLRINPVFWSANDLAKKLSDILTTEGYQASTTSGPGIVYPVTLLPVSPVNAIFVFAGSQSILDHVAAWAKELDKPNDKGVGSHFFIYRVHNTDAQSLADTLAKLLGSAVSAHAVAQSKTTAINRAPTTTRSMTGSGQVVVDAGSNSIIFKGDSEQYSQILGLLRDLDRPAREALIEVTVAEVELDNSSQLGFEWLLTKEHIGGAVTTIGTLGGLGLGTGGLTITHLNDLGATTRLLNALASTNRATILSSPRVLARSGETAHIEVGHEVPIITSQQTNPTTGGSGGILQTVQYRDTGVILSVKPVIYSGDQIDLSVSQEVSDAASTTTGVNSSPTFSTRKLQTKLALRNGATVLLGGLISKNQSNNDTGIPLLKDIPLLGQAFRNNTKTNKRTELIILITPYIISNSDDAEAVTAAFRKELGSWAQDAPSFPNRSGPAGLSLKLDNISLP